MSYTKTIDYHCDRCNTSLGVLSSMRDNQRSFIITSSHGKIKQKVITYLDLCGACEDDVIDFLTCKDVG